MLPDYIAGKLTKDKLIIRDKEFYLNSNIKLILNSELKSINREEKKATFCDESFLYYDKLLIATGAKSLIPPIKGINETGYYTINSLLDADRILNEIKNGKVLIIGAGLAGIEMAFAFRRLGIDVVMLEKFNKVLPTFLDDESADFVKEVLLSHGIDLLLGKSLCEVKGKGKINLIFDDETNYEVNHIVMTVEQGQI